MRLRTILLGPAIGLLLAPGGAIAAAQTPSAAGYSAADIPGLASGAGGPAARVGAFGASSTAPSGTTGRAAVRSSTGACATAGGVTGANCAAGQTTGCAVGDVARDPGSQAAGSAIMTAYDRDRHGARLFDGYLYATVRDPAVGASVELRGRTASGSAELLTTDELQLSRPVASAAATTRAGCVPNPCVVSATRATSIPNGPDSDSSLVLRLPVSASVAEAGFVGVLLSAFACGALVLIGRRRRRATRTAPW